MLVWLQLAGGLLAPLVWQADSEARLLAQHQRLRQRSNLPPETPAGTKLHRLLVAVRADGGSALSAVACLAALAISWSVCAQCVRHLMGE